MTSVKTAPFFDRLPLLQKIAWPERARRIPYIQQTTSTDCGAACLAMVLAYHGKRVRLEEVRDAAGVDRDGSDALAILQAARWYGLRARGVKIDIEDFTYLEPGAILHWEFNHFVVFERLHKASITIVDPAGGRQVVPLEQVGRAFTGVALTLEPADTFQPTVGERGTVWRYLQPILSQRGLLSHIGVTPLLIQLFALALQVLTGLLVDRVVPQGDFHLLLLLSVGFLSMVLFTWLPLSAPISFCICAPTWTRA